MGWCPSIWRSAIGNKLAYKVKRDRVRRVKYALTADVCKGLEKQTLAKQYSKYTPQPVDGDGPCIELKGMCGPDLKSLSATGQAVCNFYGQHELQSMDAHECALVVE